MGALYKKQVLFIGIGIVCKQYCLQQHIDSMLRFFVVYCGLVFLLFVVGFFVVDSFELF